MQSVKVNSIRRIVNGDCFKSNFQDVTPRFIEFCIDELNREILQIDFTINSQDIPYYGQDLVLFGTAVTDYFQDKNIPAIFNSCTTNSVNRIYYRAFVRSYRVVSDPEDARAVSSPKNSCEKKNEASENKKAQDPLKPEVEQKEKEKQVYEIIAEQARKPGDYSGIGFVPASSPAPPPIPLQKQQEEKPVEKILQDKIDSLNIKIFHLEQEIVTFKSTIQTKESEIAILTSAKPTPPRTFSVETLHPGDIAAARRVALKTDMPIHSESKFVQYNAGRTVEEIIIDTYYLCEALGLRGDALDAMRHIIENLNIPSDAEKISRIMFSLMMPHYSFLVRRKEEEDARRHRRR